MFFGAIALLSFKVDRESPSIDKVGVFVVLPTHHCMQGIQNILIVDKRCPRHRSTLEEAVVLLEQQANLLVDDGWRVSGYGKGGGVGVDNLPTICFFKYVRACESENIHVATNIYVHAVYVICKVGHKCRSFIIYLLP